MTVEPTLGREIRRRREAAGLSRATVAERAKYDWPTSIANIELGTQSVPYDAFVRIAEAIGIPEADWPEIMRLPVEEAKAPDTDDAAA